MMEKQRKYRKLYCPHCERSVSKSTWYCHYNQFYDCDDERWEAPALQNPDHGDFDFGSSSDSEDGSGTSFEPEHRCDEGDLESPFEVRQQ